MKPHKLAPVIGVLLLASLSCACSKLKARDQLNKGVAAFRNAQFQAAVNHFQTAVALDPTLINARLYLATAYFQQYIPGAESPENIKVAKQAIEGFEDVLKMDPNNTTAIATIAQIYYNMQKFEKAKEYNRRRLEIEPNNPEPYYWIGALDWHVCYPRRMGVRRDLNLNVPKDAAKPDILPPLPEKARAQLATQNGPLVNESIKALQRDLELKPNDSEGMAYLSLMYREKADLEVNSDGREADLRQANEWVNKALSVRKQAAERAASAVR